MINVKWRGTYGVGDFMMALNICHLYAYEHKTRIHLEMHWDHDEDYLHHPNDPETIWERMDWIHDKYHRQSDVEVEHVFDSPLFPDTFPSGHMNPDKNKTRWIWENGYGSEPNALLRADWVFNKDEFVPKKNKIICWTPHYNAEPPRKWKRFLDADDWSDIISKLQWNGWEFVELTYRTPVEEAYKHIQECDFIVCYDGMWHFIARNFSKPLFIPSWEGITKWNTPQAATRHNRDRVMEFFADGNEDFLPSLQEMKWKADRYKEFISNYHED
jgi:hypothetical protein